jgi:hypothetical protein
MEKITVEIPIISVKSNEPYFGNEYAKEHYKEGLFLVDDGIGQSLCVYDGVGCVWNMPCPVRLLQDGIEKEATEKERERHEEILENINNRLAQLARLVNECRDKCDGVINNFVEVRDDLIDTIDEKFSKMPQSSSGVDVLDLAKGLAVIQKPELIKELSK